LAKVLVIVESPAKAKTIAKFLGWRYIVRASMGHVRDLPRSQFGVDVENDFEPKYITIRGKGEIIKELKTAAKGASRVLLGPDPDREGEAIAWHLVSLLNLDPAQPCRIEFNEITKSAIEDAVKHPRPIDQDRVDAQQARRVLDRIVGYKLSPLLWRKIRRGLSAGRVQSVAVRLICEREEEIENFKPEEYWTIAAVFRTEGGEMFTARLVGCNGAKVDIGNAARAEEIVKELKAARYRIQEIKKREAKRNPPPPFTTSSLQQEANRRLNFTARKTMLIAQQLYEGLDIGKEGTVGLISYMRTDSTRISPVAQAEARSYIERKFGKDFVPAEARQYVARGKIQDAHEGIRPTSIAREPEMVKPFLTPDQYRLYRLIWERFLASQMSSAVLEVTTVDVEGKRGADIWQLRAKGSVVKFPGFMKVYTEGSEDGERGKEKEENAALPELREEDKLKLEEIIPKQHFTQPPPRYTEAGLVKALEEKGIGRPSTYAPTIETILSRGYVVKKDKCLVPTDLGKLVVELLKTYFPDVINVEFTAEMEEKLDCIEEGQLDWREVVREFYVPFSRTLQVADEQIKEIEIGDEVSEELCPQCGRNLVIKQGPFGRFLACPGFPECRMTRPLKEEVGASCPQCGSPVVARQSKKGRRFYGCSRYPECNFISWDLPSAEKCPECGKTMVVKKSRQGEYLACANRECPNFRSRHKKASEEK